MSTVGNKLFDGIEFQLNVVIKAIADNEITQARGLQILLDTFLYRQRSESYTR